MSETITISNRKAGKGKGKKEYRRKGERQLQVAKRYGRAGGASGAPKGWSDAYREVRNIEKKISIKQRKPARQNPYLMSILYPERFGGVRYPDGFVRSTCMAPLVNEYDPPFFPSGSIVEPPGDFWTCFRPSLIHPMWTYGSIPFATTGAPVWILNNDNTRYGIETLNDAVPSAQEQCDQMYLATAATYNLNMPLFYNTSNWVNDPITCMDTAGNALYGYPVALGSNTANTTFFYSLTIAGSYSTGDSVVITAATVNNPSGVQTTVNLTSTISQYSINSPAVQSMFQVDATYGTGCLATGRSNPVGFRIVYNNIANNGTRGVFLSAFQATVAGTGTLTNAVNNLMLYPTDWKDQSNLLGIATNYRPVSASIWSQWISSTLLDGGNLSQILYRGGAPPWQTAIVPAGAVSSGLLFWQGVGLTPTGWSDKAKVGGYTYYQPCSTRDTEMREPINIDEWSHPYIVVAGSIQANNASTSGFSATPLKLRYCANIEYVTTAQFTQALPSPFNPQMIESARKSLHNAPTSMDNDDHLSTIFNWLKNAGHDVMQWGVRNGGWLVPAAQALGAGAAMFL